MLRRQFVGQCGDRSGSADQGTCAVAGVMTLRAKRLAFGREESFEHRVSRRMRSGWAKRAVHRVSAIGGESFVAEHRPLTAAWEHTTEKTQARHSHGARWTSLTVASFRTWRGLQACAAWDPALNIIFCDIGSCALPKGGIPPRCGGLRV